MRVILVGLLCTLFELNIVISSWSIVSILMLYQALPPLIVWDWHDDLEILCSPPWFSLR